MGRIHRMSEPLANKIAAGEVVERPASVVKELVENAIDAHAKQIRIEVEEGGLQKIKVIDDGHGFEPDDCELAFERHATSKIKDEPDLFRIRTLGFRGEALPSIASVSHIEMRTASEHGEGRRLVLHGGQIISSGASHGRQGTELIVTNLFYNTPARLKHLKTIHTELANITDVLNKIAFAHPEVRLELLHNNKTLLHTNGSGDIAQVLASIYGVQTARNALPLSANSLDYELKGHVIKPEITRAGRHYVYLLINGRYIRNYTIFNAVLKGYHTLLPIGRYPIAVIHVIMDPTLMDINVHPAKLEVRLSKEKELCELIEQTIKDTFHREQLIPAVQRNARKEKPYSKQQALELSPFVSNRSQETVSQQNERSIAKASLVKEENANALKSQDGEADLQRVSKQVDAFHEETDDAQDVLASALAHGRARFSRSSLEKLDPTELESKRDEHRMPALYPIGQMHGTYIMAQNETGLFIIDQHAAQERIKYEFYREKVGETAQEAQKLLMPMTFDFTASEIAIIENFQEELTRIGLPFEPFGEHSYILREHPRWFPPGKEQETIEDIIQQILEDGKVSVKKLREDLAIMMSCKKSIKANHHLHMDEIVALLDQLTKAEDPFTCPHGRPVILQFTTYEMEKMFKRVM